MIVYSLLKQKTSELHVVVNTLNSESLVGAAGGIGVEHVGQPHSAMSR